MPTCYQKGEMSQIRTIFLFIPSSIYNKNTMIMMVVTYYALTLHEAMF